MLYFIILMTCFTNTQFWLTQSLASLYRKPRLLSSLHQILESVSIVSHSIKHERKLEVVRMSNANPHSYLISGSGVWNVCVIDNIDFKQKSFAWGNIYDVTRSTTHAILRLVFQFTLPLNISLVTDETIELNENSFMIGRNKDADDVVQTLGNIIQQFLAFKNNHDGSFAFAQNFNIEIINKKITEIYNINVLCLLLANIVILEARDNPNNDDDVNKSCDQYFKDLNIPDNESIYICCDEAIFRRVMRYYIVNHKVRPLLGQWHTSKDMCSALLVTFSSYGIYNIAAKLGVKFLDKLEQVADYRSTCRVLDLIWNAVGCALYIYSKKNNIDFNTIMEKDNDLVKVWYCFFEWSSYWKGHRIGIRTGNALMQLKCLEAFALLFSTAGKNNYMKSIVQYLSIVAKYPRLQKLLSHIGSVNLTCEGHYYAFDEALETFGVKFIKQNITGNICDNETLKRQIKASQAERERMDLLIGEFTNDITISQTERAVNSRQEELWLLINSLVDAFESQIPTDHLLFKNYKELTSTGYKKLIESYESGKERLMQIYRQEVLHVESINTKGRRAKGVVVTKVKDIQEMNRVNKRRNQIESVSITSQSDFVSNPQPILPEPQNTLTTINNERPIKRTRHTNTNEEIEILNPYLANTNPTDNDTNLTLNALLCISDH